MFFCFFLRYASRLTQPVLGTITSTWYMQYLTPPAPCELIDGDSPEDLEVNRGRMRPCLYHGGGIDGLPISERASEAQVPPSWNASQIGFLWSLAGHISSPSAWIPLAGHGWAHTRPERMDTTGWIPGVPVSAQWNTWVKRAVWSRINPAAPSPAALQSCIYTALHSPLRLSLLAVMLGAAMLLFLIYTADPFWPRGKRLIVKQNV